MLDTRTVPLTVGLAISLITGASALGQGDRLTIEDAVAMRAVSSARIAPDGQHVVYTLSVPRTEDDKPGVPYREIWVTALDDPAPRRYSREQANASSPRWSPDGTHIAFLAAGDGEDDGTQIHVIPVDGGEASMLTNHETDVRELRWSPDGTRIAFLAGSVATEEEIAEEESGRDWTVVGDDPARDRLWIADATTGKVEPVYEGNLHAVAFEWTPDGRTLVFVAADAPDADSTLMYSRLYRVNTPDRTRGGARDGGAPDVLAQTEGKLGDFAVSPDGATLAFLGAVSLNDPLAQSVFVTPMDGSEPVNLSEGLQASSSRIAWLDDGKLLELADTGTRSTLSVIDVASGARRTIVDGRGREPGEPIVSAFSAHRSGRYVAIAHRASHPRELYTGKIDGTLRRVTTHNREFARKRLARVETVAWFSTDAQRIEGVLTYPTDYEEGRRYPLVVNPHGGPEGVSHDGWNEFPQLLAAQGFAVLQPNYRGSGGRGVEFSKGDHDDLGGQEFRDILGGINLLIDRGIADRERVGMGGWSYGGYLSAMAATHYSDRFKAAVMGAGISNWVSFTGTTDIPDEMSIVHWNRPMRGSVDLYWGRSPLSAMDRARTPTLIIFGANDDRVPPGQGHELHHALRKRGIPTEMVLYPRAGHGVRERAHRIDVLTRQIEWFERYVR